MKHYLGDIYAILTAFAWSGAVIFFKLSQNHLKTVPLKVFQNVVAVLLFFLSLLALQEPLWLELTIQEWALVGVSAVVGISLGDTLFMAAIDRIGASLQAVVDGLYMPIVMVLAFLFFGETLSSRVLLGASFVIFAIGLAHVELSRLSISKRRLWSGIGLAILSQLAIASCVLMMKGLLKTQPLLTLTAYRFLIGSVVLIGVYFLKANRASLFLGFRPSRAWKITLPGAILGPYMATLLWFSGFKYTLAGKAAIYNQLSTLLIIVLAAIFLKERLTRHRLAAMALAVFGSYLVISD